MIRMWALKCSIFLLSLIILLSLILFSLFQRSSDATLVTKKCYIVYFGTHEHGPEVTEEHFARVTHSHHNFLKSFLGSKAKDALIESYHWHINGFAAHLEEEEAAEIARHPKVVSVFLNQGKTLHTTHSWEFMLLEKDGLILSHSAWNKARFGEDTIIANIDTGVWPESKSFGDEGIGPIPSRWRGVCENGTTDSTTFYCNRKLIGARYFNKGYAAANKRPLNPSLNTARDYDGHGSHTLSIAGGNFVPGANVTGVANGTAKGGSPKARVATYKVCWPKENQTLCSDADILKAFDMAINDGVDVISVSLGGSDAADYFNDSVAIGAFHAVMKGIVVVCSAGNSGPKAASVSNVSPWTLSVAASTLDRKIQDYVELRSGQRFKGTSISEPLPEERFYPLITGAQAKSAHASAADATLCKRGALDHAKVKGKILVCLRGEIPRVEKGQNAAEAGAAGMILCNDKESGNETIPDLHHLPASHINYKDGLAVFAYIYSTDDPMGFITIPDVELKTKPAPHMAHFSSRGPNKITPEILKPDVTAPGVNIIAAYTQARSSPELDIADKRIFPFLFQSGTSMSAPHVSGVAGLLKTLHPDWSPAAISSAIITTARTRDNTASPMLDGSPGNKATPFNYGAGHIRPNRAMDPGLVYDLTVNDYLDFLCGSGYNQTMIEKLSESSYQCPKSYSLLDFNYPSISIPKLKGSVTVTRKVKNVGSGGTYAAQVRQPKGVRVSVAPKVLRFERIGEEKRFKLTFKAKSKGLSEGYEFGGLTWSDGKHYVRSPIVVAAVGHTS